ncbi:tyrosinase family protein [Bradyrhizobium cenepequi]|uniref:tyrosinase family protein n=1 Tax=Bradyrhizobium cenepequi TaxID=2821403 RepID=UPI0035D745DC
MTVHPPASLFSRVNRITSCTTVGGAYNGLGGFMQVIMSPTNPIFYLRHANMDRLWDV